MRTLATSWGLGGLRSRFDNGFNSGFSRFFRELLDRLPGRRTEGLLMVAAEEVELNPSHLLRSKLRRQMSIDLINHLGRGIRRTLER